jgi:hypothetical protein
MFIFSYLQLFLSISLIALYLFSSFQLRRFGKIPCPVTTSSLRTTVLILLFSLLFPICLTNQAPAIEFSALPFPILIQYCHRLVTRHGYWIYCTLKHTAFYAFAARCLVTALNIVDFFQLPCSRSYWPATIQSRCLAKIRGHTYTESDGRNLSWTEVP